MKTAIKGKLFIDLLDGNSFGNDLIFSLFFWIAGLTTMRLLGIINQFNKRKEVEGDGILQFARFEGRVFGSDRLA